MVWPFTGRPDLVIYSNSTRQVILLELTVPVEDNIVPWHIKKEEKYEKLIDDISMNQWSGHVFGIEVGSRGYVAKSLGFALGKLGLGQSSIRSLKKSVSLICLRSSYLIYLSRKNASWRPWEAKPHPLGKQKVIPGDATILDVTGDFDGFSQSEIREGAYLNTRKSSHLRTEAQSLSTHCVTGDFDGFSQQETKEASKLNSKRCSRLKTEVKCLSGRSETKVKMANIRNPRKTCDPKSKACGTLSNHTTQYRKKGLLNIGNTCYMNSVMQCLNSLPSFVQYFKDSRYCRDIDSRSKYDGIFAKEMGATLELMNIACSPVSLYSLKTAVGELHHPFKGSMQQDAHEFLLYMLNWLHEDLGGNASPAPFVDNPRNSEFDSLIQGINQYSIICSACHYESASCEPFTIISLSLPSRGRCTLEGMLEKSYTISYIDYKCPQCNIHGKCTRRSEIKKLPSVLILHLKRFDNSSRKKENEIEFPLVNLSLPAHAMQRENCPAIFNLCSVTNHYGSLTTGHYTSLCRSPDGGTWYKCDDRYVTRTRMSSISSAAYLLFSELSTLGNASSTRTL